MNVLSLFDGMSCGQIALNRNGIKVDNYFASEIEKPSIAVTMDNYPRTIQLGDVCGVKGSAMPEIDLLLGGSPCQGFSYAGKGLNFDDPRSKLFFEYVRLLNEVKPKHFLLENVPMLKEHEIIISKYLGVEPIFINSALVSAQNRERIYWTNINLKQYGLFCEMIADIPQPKDKGILLKDIIQKQVDESLFINMDEYEFKKLDSHVSDNGLICLGGILSDKVKLWKQDAKRILQRNFGQGQRVYSDNGKCCTLSAQGGGLGALTGLYYIDGRIRRLTANEAEMLQTVPIDYCNKVSRRQGLKMLGNGWTVDVICHILKYMT